LTIDILYYPSSSVSQLLNSYFYSRNRELKWDNLEVYEVEFIDNNPKIGHLQSNINSNYYSDSYIKLEDLQNYCVNNKLKLRKHMDFIAMGGFKHEIFEITKL
jgi:hypothetical protein